MGNYPSVDNQTTGQSPIDKFSYTSPLNGMPTAYTQQKTPEQLIGNILAIAESGHGHLRVLVSEAACAIQTLKNDNQAMRAALSTIAESHGRTKEAVDQITEIANDCLGSLSA